MARRVVPARVTAGRRERLCAEIGDQMGNPFRWLLVASTSAVVLSVLSLTVKPTAAQAPTYRAPRTADGKPNLNGIWQALNTANWDIQDHAARPGPPQFGALFSVPAGLAVVVGNEIPYQPWAVEKKKENLTNWLTADPEVNCYMPGVPRATYIPHPFSVFQTPKYILMVYEFANATRTIYMDNPELESPADTWMGHSRGRWEGETLVIDVTSFNGQTWFDRAGNFNSDALHVVERYTHISADVLTYEATIEDPKVFTRPWKMSMPLYRRLEKNAQLTEFNCVPFAEELLYGHLRKQTSK